MAVATHWKVLDMTHMDSDGGVILVRWECRSKNDSGPETAVYADKYKTEYDPSSPSFIPYDQLTEETVLGWVWADLGAEEKASIEATLVAKVDAQIQRNSTESVGVPWSTEPAEV